MSQVAMLFTVVCRECLTDDPSDEVFELLELLEKLEDYMYYHDLMPECSKSPNFVIPETVESETVLVQRAKQLFDKLGIHHDLL